MKTFIYNFLMPLIGILVIIVNIPDVKKIITDYSGEHSPIIITIFLIGASLLNYFMMFRIPYKELQERNKERLEKFNTAALEAIKIIKEHSKIDVSFNVMKPKRKLVSFQPGKITFFPSVFEVVMEAGRNHVNSRLKITTKQGACGMAYMEEDFFSFDLEKMKKIKHNFEKEFNFTSAQVRLTEKVTMVAACPIILRKIQHDKQTIKLVGVLCVESRITGAGILTDPSNEELLYEIMESLVDKAAVI